MTAMRAFWNPCLKAREDKYNSCGSRKELRDVCPAYMKINTSYRRLSSSSSSSS
jgi:hypothetical protein